MYILTWIFGFDQQWKNLYYEYRRYFTHSLFNLINWSVVLFWSTFPGFCIFKTYSAILSILCSSILVVGNWNIVILWLKILISCVFTLVDRGQKSTEAFLLIKWSKYITIRTSYMLKTKDPMSSKLFQLYMYNR